MLKMNLICHKNDVDVVLLQFQQRFEPNTNTEEHSKKHCSIISTVKLKGVF